DYFYGGAGMDAQYGGQGDDQFYVADGELANGEGYDGGDGDDTLTIYGGDGDLTGITFSSIETLTTNLALTLTNGQIAGFSTISASGLTFADTGLIDLEDTQLQVYSLYLNNAGNTLDL